MVPHKTRHDNTNSEIGVMTVRVLEDKIFYALS